MHWWDCRHRDAKADGRASQTDINGPNYFNLILQRGCHDVLASLNFEDALDTLTRELPMLGPKWSMHSSVMFCVPRYHLFGKLMTEVEARADMCTMGI